MTIKNGWPFVAWPKRFWDKVEKTDGCWNFTATKQSRGYGQISVDGVVKYAHRVAYELQNGAIPAGLTIDHLCRNKLCVRGEHPPWKGG